MSTKNKLNDDGAEEASPPIKEKASKSEQIGNILELAKDSPKMADLSDDQKEIALEIVRKMFERFPTLDFPKQNEDGTIEMDLMLGGHIKIAVPKGYQVMAAQREMVMHEKGKFDRDEMLPVYIMAACSEIDETPATIFDIHDKLHARDYNQLLNFFRSVNLL